METIMINEDIQGVCIPAKSFPEGIQEAHDRLHTLIPFSEERRYFGLSRPERGVIVYKAAAEVLENETYNGPSCIIEKGEYRCITLLNYKNDLQRISQAFETLLSFPDIAPDGYCVEWYHHGEDMTCMVRLRTKEQ
ncbi:hypothetical protein GCM10011391_12290 [Pullulanibacillus camelliae]|uniref:Uncharacterized protein n=1 Tax=Pullulanibacillus camelliae TaxID=1707096 RepID=A0A8J2VKV2_9BACL|nr:transcriptional regulator [Pullulanibacillus camelliae]GGE35121.1 hypothetical protein GCM10011391_12290 [Pullulanibacillus camelliae]